jgi:hypothetical protein
VFSPGEVDGTRSVPLVSGLEMEETEQNPKQKWKVVLQVGE